MERSIQKLIVEKCIMADVHQHPHVAEYQDEPNFITVHADRVECIALHINWLIVAFVHR